MRAKLNGTEIYFDIEGPELAPSIGKLEKRPTIVALHGGPGFDHGYLKGGVGALRDMAQMVYVDLRGQGRSGRPPLDTFTLEQTADDVAALCEHVGIERPIVFGHSAGGFTALHLALRHPSLVRALILSDTIPTFAPIPDDDKPRPQLASRATPEVAATAQRFFGGDRSPETVQAFNEKVMPYYAGPSHMDIPGKLLPLSMITMDIMDYFFTKVAPTYDVRPRLAEIACPTLVLVGAHDWVCSPTASRVIARGIPGAKLLEYETAGHFPFAEEPERFRKDVADFLSS